MIEHLALIAAWIGEETHLATVARLPLFTLNYGSLKLLVYWDPLLGEPHFEKIVASLVPKD